MYFLLFYSLKKIINLCFVHSSVAFALQEKKAYMVISLHAMISSCFTWLGRVPSVSETQMCVSSQLHS